MRRLPWLAAALFVAAVFAWIATDPRVPKRAFEKYAVHNTSSEGLSLAYRYLGSTGRAVEVLTRPLERAFLDPRAVLFRVRPDSAVPPGLRKPRAAGG